MAGLDYLSSSAFFFVQESIIAAATLCIGPSSFGFFMVEIYEN
jgi:hypothetical protein